MLQLVEPDTPQRWLEARGLVQEYVASLDVDLDFQDVHHELDTLASEYGPPGGCFVLATWSGALVGCGGIRPLTDSSCEMKRLYVASSHRGRGIGYAIAKALVERARQLYYATMLLDTLPAMEAAQHIYARLGFVETTPYRHNPLPGATFLRLSL